MSITRRELGTMTAAALASAAAADAAEPRRAAPEGPVCDCHVHIIGSPERYPMDPKRVYTPPQASVADLRAMRARTGIARNVLVQPSFYGTDNRCLVDALAALDGTARGVAVVADDAPEGLLHELHEKGVRGIRFNFETGGERDPRTAARRLAAMAPRLAPLGWHIQVYTAPEVVVGLAAAIAASPVPVVIDHFGLFQAAKGVEQPGFAGLRELVRAGRAYVKLSAPHRISAQEPDYPDVAPLARALIAANRERMLWGSDWPHTVRSPGKGPLDIHPFRVVDDGRDLALLRAWAGDPATAKAILVDNPARLYGFG